MATQQKQKSGKLWNVTLKNTDTSEELGNLRTDPGLMMDHRNGGITISTHVEKN